MQTGNDTENDVSWALKLIEHDPDYRPNLLSDYKYPIYLAIGFAGGPITGNLLQRRPAWAGIHQHIIATAVGIGIGLLVRKRSMDVCARNDAIRRDYIITHPQDFPPPERKKYGDLFNPWVPYR